MSRLPVLMNLQGARGVGLKLATFLVNPQAPAVKTEVSASEDEEDKKSDDSPIEYEFEGASSSENDDGDDAEDRDVDQDARRALVLAAAEKRASVP